ncbi:hypothetical protein EYF80_035453 [Liparis tanakae]|uniref:Uncharacterized protein n=1 Tax=Liparis tanakae TaxID=230148 RepID=A0A4Z2GNC6_9TELE|nr:hypothetical protein EYF80_035453 [Liparis tanakae]
MKPGGLPTATESRPHSSVSSTRQRGWRGCLFGERGGWFLARRLRLHNRKKGRTGEAEEGEKEEEEEEEEEEGEKEEEEEDAADRRSSVTACLQHDTRFYSGYIFPSGANGV